MRPLLLALLLAGCSRGGAECLDTPDCPAPMACDLQLLRCVQVDEPRDLMSRTEPLDFSAPPDLSPADLKCDLAAGWRFCSGVCVSPLGNDQNCGACGRSCGPSDLGAPTSCCNASCTDRKRDTNHCGRCFNVCGGAAPWCCDGMCSSQRCT